MKKQKLNEIDEPHLNGCGFFVQKSNKSRYFYRILIEKTKELYFLKEKFAIISIKKAVTGIK